MYYSWEIYSNFHSVLYSISLEFKIEPNPIDIGKFLIFTSYSFLFISFTIFIVKLLHTINFLCSFNIFIHEYFHLIQSFFYSFRSYKASYSSPIHDHKFKNTTQSNRTLIFHIIFLSETLHSLIFFHLDVFSQLFIPQFILLKKPHIMVLTT